MEYDDIAALRSSSIDKITNDQINKKFEKEYKQRKVLLIGGQSGICIGWYERYGENIRKFRIKVKQTIYIIPSDHIIGWEHIAKNKR